MFLSVKREEFDKGKLTVDRQVIPKISEALERKTEHEVRQNYKSISQEVMESLDYTEAHPTPAGVSRANSSAL